jgi:predicted nucleic acid-binding protein
MSSDLVLVDTSAWIEFFRKDQKGSITAIEVERLLSEDLVVATEPVLVELAAGVRDKKSLAQLVEMFSSFHDARVTEQVWSAATENVFLLRSRGYTIPLADHLIATVAISYGLPLLHLDKHFGQIASVLSLKEHVS